MTSLHYGERFFEKVTHSVGGVGNIVTPLFNGKSEKSSKQFLILFVKTLKIAINELT